VLTKKTINGKRFKTEIKNRKLEYALEMSRFNHKYYEEAKKISISTMYFKYRSIF